MSKPLIPQPRAEELVASALNEQGYLLHYKIADILSGEREGKQSHQWHIEASEVPVSIANGAETKIDLVLRHGTGGIPWRLIIECKRSARDYKKWVFFGEKSLAPGPSITNYYVECVDLAETWNHVGDPKFSHRVEEKPADGDCVVFEYGIEARINLPGRDQRYSATNAIEDAFQQVTLGYYPRCSHHRWSYSETRPMLAGRI